MPSFTPDMLRSGESLLPGECLTSSNGRYTARIGRENRLQIVRHNGEVIWSAADNASYPRRTKEEDKILDEKDGFSADCRLYLTSLGDLKIFKENTKLENSTRKEGHVVRRSQCKQIWSSQTARHGVEGSYLLVMQNDRNLVLYQYPSEKSIWSSRTATKRFKAPLSRSDIRAWDSVSTRPGTPSKLYSLGAFPTNRCTTHTTTILNCVSSSSDLEDSGENIQREELSQVDSSLIASTTYSSLQGSTIATASVKGACSSSSTILPARGSLVAPPVITLEDPQRQQPSSVTSLRSTNGRYFVVVIDGRLIVYDEAGEEIWASAQPPSNVNKKGRVEQGGEGDSVYFTVIDQGRLFLIHESSGEIVWRSGVKRKGQGPYTLVLQNDRNLVLYDRRESAVWSTKTHTYLRAPLLSSFNVSNGADDLSSSCYRAPFAAAAVALTCSQLEGMGSDLRSASQLSGCDTQPDSPPSVPRDTDLPATEDATKTKMADSEVNHATFVDKNEGCATIKLPENTEESAPDSGSGPKDTFKEDGKQVKSSSGHVEGSELVEESTCSDALNSDGSSSSSDGFGPLECTNKEAVPEGQGRRRVASTDSTDDDWNVIN